MYTTQLLIHFYFLVLFMQSSGEIIAFCENREDKHKLMYRLYDIRMYIENSWSEQHFTFNLGVLLSGAIEVLKGLGFTIFYNII